MLISFNWIRDFVDLPGDVDMSTLAERFTLTCAEVEGMERIAPEVEGIVAAEVKDVEPLIDQTALRRVTLEAGHGRQFQTVTSAVNLTPGDKVLFAPPGARIGAHSLLGETTIHDVSSSGMLVDAESIGITAAGGEAVFLPPSIPNGEILLPAVFADWVMEIDNKAITHRPDLWGHYGIARELAAMLRLPLKRYPVVDLASLADDALPEIPIEIDQPDLCPRYSGLVMEGVGSQPSPLWMQLRLGRVGVRPIDALVDLTNYVMAELGQPLHAFDGDRVQRIEVGTAPSGTTMTTLDGVERRIPETGLLIMSGREPVALAGIMGGLNSEVSQHTRSILLESANFEPAVIRRCATSIGLRTEASARFEKSLDPAHTVLAIQRFVCLAKDLFPDLRLKSRLSDANPLPQREVSIVVHPEAIERTIGFPVPVVEMERILRALEFDVNPRDDGAFEVRVPSFRATRDISIEADITEEIARFVGYDNIEPQLPEVSVRYFEPNALHSLDHSTLRHLCGSEGFHEIFGYIWYDRNWNRQLGYDPGQCLTLRNPAAQDCDQLRRSLMPDLLHALDLNRHHFDELRLLELGSTFAGPADAPERRQLGMLLARKQKGGDVDAFQQLKASLESWAVHVLDRHPEYVETQAVKPWDHPSMLAGVAVAARSIGRVGVVPLALKRNIDDHLANWAVAWADLDLNAALDMEGSAEKLNPIPEFPRVEMDFSFLVPAAQSYSHVMRILGGFDHPLLQRIAYIGHYEGKGIDPGRRSLTFRATLGSDTRTLSDADGAEFRRAFEELLQSQGYALRT